MYFSFFLSSQKYKHQKAGSITRKSEIQTCKTEILTEVFAPNYRIYVLNANSSLDTYLK